MLCEGFITLSSKFYVWMDYIHSYGISIESMICHMLYLQKTHVIYNKKQEQYGIKSKNKKLNYAMLCYAILCENEIKRIIVSLN